MQWRLCAYICWSWGDTCVHKFGYQAPDRTTLHIQMCLDWPWQVTKRQTSSDSVPFHAPASYYLTAPLTLHALYFPFIHFYNPSFPREQAHHQSWRFSQGKACMHIKHIDVLFCNFSFVTSVFPRTWRKLCVVLLNISHICALHASAIIKYTLLKLELRFTRARTHGHPRALSRLTYIIPRGCVLILLLFV